MSQESRMWFNASPPDEKLRGAERSRIVFYPIHNPKHVLRIYISSIVHHLHTTGRCDS